MNLPKSKTPPEGYKLFSSPLEYVKGMEGLFRPKTDWYWGQATEYFSLETNPELYAYLKLSPEMLSGPNEWWDSNQLFSDHGIPLSETCLLPNHAHPWLLEQWLFVTKNIDLIAYRTKNHPQYLPENENNNN